MKSIRSRKTVAATLMGLGLFSSAQAADGFRVRFPLSGTLGGEIVAPVNRSGFFGSLAVTQIDIEKITDGSGEARNDQVNGNFATPTPVAGAVRTATFSGNVHFDGRQSQTQGNLLIGYLSEQIVAGGRLSVALNIPYSIRLNQRLVLSGATPTLSPLTPPLTSPPLPAGAGASAQAAAQAGFANAYQGNLATQSASGTGEVDGLGDMELTGAWVYQDSRLKLVVGTTLAMPTGDYDPQSGVNVGYGNYYTLRQGLAAAYAASESWTVGLRTSIAFNTRNKDNQVRSGNFAAIDLAAAYRGSLGVIGPHVLHVQQFQDDSGGMFGTNRFRATGAGLFVTTLIPSLGTAMNVSYMRMLDARNALSGSFFQLRFSKTF